MGLTLLELMQEGNFTVNNFSFWLITSMFVLDMVDHLRMIVYPAILVANTYGGLECSVGVQYLFGVSSEFHIFVDPLIYQILMIATIWMFSKIQELK